MAKIGRKLIELAEEIERQYQSKRDYRGSLAKVAMQNGALVGVDSAQPLELTTLAHRQLGEFCGIPAQYYDRMKAEQPQLLDTNVNGWLQKEAAQKRTIRVLDGRVRAFLSDKYRTLENYDLFQAVYPALRDRELIIISCEITERRLYVKAIDKNITKAIPTGQKLGEGHFRIDTLSPAITISNSEVGGGSLSVELGIFTDGCTNLVFFSNKALKKYHIGGKGDVGADMQQVLTDETKRVSDAATWMQLRDVVGAAFDQAKFQTMADEIAGTVEDRITNDPMEVIESTAKRFGLAETEKTSVLRHLIEGGDLTRYGVFNAVTRAAEDAESYDRATELERIGGQIVELPRNDWQQFAAAA